MSQQTDEWLSQCRANFGEPPRRVSWFTHRKRLRIQGKKRLAWKHKPFLILKRIRKIVAKHHGDPLVQMAEDQLRLQREGHVVWGWFVQANADLFSPGDSDLPAVILYSPDAPESVPFEELAPVAHSLFALKSDPGTHPECVAFGAHLADEYERRFGYEVPGPLKPSWEARISAVQVTRSHLPTGFLSYSYVPLIVDRDEPHYVQPLPYHYWPSSLVAEWVLNSK